MTLAILLLLCAGMACWATWQEDELKAIRKEIEALRAKLEEDEVRDKIKELDKARS